MRKILVLLTTMLILGLCGIFISESLPQATSYFVLPISTGMTSLAASTMVAVFLYQFFKGKKEVGEKEPEVEELERALYECQLMRNEISKVWYEGKPTEELYNKSWEIARKIIPNLQKLKNYKTFLRKNPDIVRSIYLIEKLWQHYHGGKRIKGKGPYREMGTDLIRFYRASEKL